MCFNLWSCLFFLCYYLVASQVNGETYEKANLGSVWDSSLTLDLQGGKVYWPFSQTHNPSRITSPPFNSLSPAFIPLDADARNEKMQLEIPACHDFQFSHKTDTYTIDHNHRKGFNDMEVLRNNWVLTGQSSHLWWDTWSGIGAGPRKKRKTKEKGCSGSRNKGCQHCGSWAIPRSVARGPAHCSRGFREGASLERGPGTGLQRTSALRRSWAKQLEPVKGF